MHSSYRNCGKWWEESDMTIKFFIPYIDDIRLNNGCFKHAEHDFNAFHKNIRKSHKKKFEKYEPHESKDMYVCTFDTTRPYNNSSETPLPSSTDATRYSIVIGFRCFLPLYYHCGKFTCWLMQNSNNNNKRKFFSWSWLKSG